MIKKIFIPASCLFLAIIFLATGCKKGTAAITIESPQAAISPMLVGVASIFMKINNNGNGGDILLGATTDMPGAITELHDIIDGKMVKVDSINIPAGSRVVLRPAKHHIMILKMPKDMKEGSGFNLILKFKNSGDKTIPLKLTMFSPGSREFN